ncbi:MAG TPA: hypothetical protein VE860_22110 [Chthoniobacterales bacterium]|jgi:REP element-mobilizing transposase RayT|nr:hypothetical protein [Chthoniobacterales bacterium]
MRLTVRLLPRSTPGFADHVHLLLSMPTTMVIAKAKAREMKFDEKYLWD